jgi:hypothetical protein
VVGELFGCATVDGYAIDMRAVAGIGRHGDEASVRGPGRGAAQIQCSATGRAPVPSAEATWMGRPSDAPDAKGQRVRSGSRTCSGVALGMTPLLSSATAVVGASVLGQQDDITRGVVLADDER